MPGCPDGGPKSRGLRVTALAALAFVAGTPGGACLIDTPGLRTLRLDTDASALGAAFCDIELLASGCRFRDCRHEDEPGCAVRGAVPPERLRSFHKMQREALRDQVTALQRKAEVAVWKARSREARMRAGAKRV